VRDALREWAADPATAIEEVEDGWLVPSE
jgi:hypothetical protein